MTNDEIAAAYERATGLKVKCPDGTPAGGDCWDVGAHSVWEEGGTWRVGRGWSSYSRDSGWDGGCDELPEDEGGGPHKSFEDALRAAIRAQTEYAMAEAGEAVGDCQRAEYEQVEEVMDS